MSATSAFLKEFIRKVFRDANASGTTTEAVLDSLSDIALEASNDASGSGRALTGITTREGVASTWQVLRGLGGYDRQILLIDSARTVIGSETELTDIARDAVLAKIRKVSRYSTSFKEGVA